jgi:hypothetical protein
VNTWRAPFRPARKGLLLAVLLGLPTAVFATSPAVASAGDYRPVRTTPGSYRAYGEDVGAPSSAITSLSAVVGQPVDRPEALSRAAQWVGVVSYSQDQKLAAPDGDGHTYRPDCSGFVSMAWHLPKKADGWDFNTGDFGAWSGKMYLSSLDELRAGDAILGVSYGHIALFDHWDDSQHTSATVYEEYKTGTTAAHHSVSRGFYTTNGFRGIRYLKMSGMNSLSGDGRAELVGLDASGADADRFTVHPNVAGLDGNWGAPYPTASGWTDPDRVRFADLDADGRTDLIRIDPDGTLTAFRNGDAAGNQWYPGVTVGTGWSDPSRTLFADLNGDGKADLISVDSNGDLRAFPNVDGLNFSWGSPRVVGTGWYDPSRVRFADLDGDGRAEVISIDANGDLRAFPNVDGINFWWGSARVVGDGWMEPSRTRFADLDGDGRAEVISIDANGDLRAFPNVDGLNFSWGDPRVVSTGWTDPARTFVA